LYDAGDEALAGRVLTFYAHARAEDALALGEALVESVEARTRLRREVPRPAGDAIHATDRDTVSCRRPRRP
ncbi:MAG: peptidase U34, partial [Myxococcota bacterium]|nr:peptidase U34 [Myxococcota bacterium]